MKLRLNESQEELRNDKKEIKVKEQPTTEQNKEVNLW